MRFVYPNTLQSCLHSSKQQSRRPDSLTQTCIYLESVTNKGFRLCFWLKTVTHVKSLCFLWFWKGLEKLNNPEYVNIHRQITLSERRLLIRASTHYQCMSPPYKFVCHAGGSSCVYYQGQTSCCHVLHVNVSCPCNCTALL